MRSKTPLILMEQVVMVLVFALAAALCLRVFAFSNQMSERSKDVDNAVLLAQNTAEMIKACGGVEEATEVMGGKIRQTLWSTYYDADMKPVPDQVSAYYEVNALPENSDVKGLGRANIEVVRFSEEEALFSLTVAWREVNGNG